MKTKFSAKTMMGIALLGLSGAALYLLPYIRWSYYDAALEASGLNNTQFGITMSVYGIVGMIFYAPGGWLADKVSARKLLSISTLGVGLLGFWYASCPGYIAQLMIYAGWGILATLTFWSAMMKATRQLGSSEEQGRLFGFVEGGRGILSTVLSFICLFLFGKLGEGLGGFKEIVITMSVLNIITAVLNFIFLKDSKDGAPAEAKKKAAASDIIAILKMPAVWLIALVIVCCYSIYLGSTYLTPYFTNVIGATASMAAFLAIMRSYILQFICGPSGGILADKTRSVSKVIIGSYVVITVAMAAVLVLPSTKNMMIPLVVILIVLCAGIFAMRGIYFATIDEVGIPLNITGTAVGIVSLIGFLPDVFMSTLCGSMLDRYDGAAGYRAIFIVMMVFAVVGLLAAILLNKVVKKQKAL